MEPERSAFDTVDRVLRLSQDVVRRFGPNGRVYLTQTASGRVLQIGGLGAEVLSRLDAGVRLEQLVEDLERRFPNRTDVRAQTTSFVKRLADTGMIDGASERQKPSAHMLTIPPLNPISKGVARALAALPRAVRHVVGALTITASIAVLVFAVHSGRIVPLMRISYWDVLKSFAILPVSVLLHEVAHAVSARLAGLKNADIGLVVKRFMIAPMMRSSPDFMLLGRVDRMSICLAGPFCDVVVMGLVAAVLLVSRPGGEIACIASVFLLFKGLATSGNLSPFMKSDLSDAMQALFDDYTLRSVALGRKASRSSSAHAVSVYRGIAAVYVTFIVLIWGALVFSVAGWEIRI